MQAFDAIDHSRKSGKDYCGCASCKADADEPCKDAKGQPCDWTPTNGGRCKSSCTSGQTPNDAAPSLVGGGEDDGGGGWVCKQLVGAEEASDKERGSLNAAMANTLYMGVGGEIYFETGAPATGAAQPSTAPSEVKASAEDMRLPGGGEGATPRNLADGKPHLLVLTSEVAMDGRVPRNRIRLYVDTDAAVDKVMWPKNDHGATAVTLRIGADYTGRRFQGEVCRPAFINDVALTRDQVSGMRQPLNAVMRDRCEGRLRPKCLHAR